MGHHRPTPPSVAHDTSPWQDMACQVCHAPLNTFGDPDHPAYRHPLYRATDHEPVPVPTTDLDTVARVCDLCGDHRPLWTLTGGDLAVLGLGPTGAFQHHYGTQWAACPACEHLITTGKPDKILDRAAATLDLGDDTTTRAHLATLHQAFLRDLQPHRTVITTTAWPPATITPRDLPKIRDRLAGFYQGPHRLHGWNLTTEDRDTLAQRLLDGGMFWVDDTFTTLAEHVATHLPAVTIDPHDMPNPDGLIIWHHPATTRGVAAASWTATANGWRLTTYRSLGTDVDAPVLQHVREHLGWLIPAHTTTVEAGTTLAGGHPAAPLIATWLLIAQKIADTQPVDLDPRTRKAYARAHRPPPQVRVVRIRGHAARTTASSPDTGRKLTTRVFVSGHWRNQPYGKGRALRKPIYINPFLRGPADQPVRTATTVRVLGSTRPTPTPGHDPN